MKEKLYPFFNSLFGDSVPIKRRFFHIVCFGAPIFSLLATIANLISNSTGGDNSKLGLMACAICCVTCLALYPLSKVIKNIDVLIGIVAVGMNFFIMPFLYCTLGGIMSGMPIYFVIAIVFSVLMLDSVVKGSILVVCAFAWYGLILYADATNWHNLHDLITDLCVYHGNEYLDTFCDLIVVASCIAVLVKILSRNFEKQQAKTDRLLAQMEELAVKDPLTGAYNRRFLIKYLESGMDSAISQNKNMAVVMFDIDKFKRINDDYGHLVGDEVIKALSSTLIKSCRDYDIVSRYGGEEFVLVMPGATEEVAIARADQIRQTFSSMKITDEIDRPVTISGGVAQLKSNMKTTEAFIGAADDNLYIAKETGRNRIVGSVYNHDLPKVPDPDPR